MLAIAKPQLTNFLDEFFGYSTDNPDMMKCDVVETKEAFTFEFDLPGVTKNNIDISVKDNDLTVTAKREAKKNDGTLLRSEKSWGSFKRVFSLPHRTVQLDAIEANYQDGVLTIVVPKSAAGKPLKIAIGDGK